jgi:hypothetical protein
LFSRTSIDIRVVMAPPVQCAAAAYGEAPVRVAAGHGRERSRGGRLAHGSEVVV